VVRQILSRRGPSRAERAISLGSLQKTEFKARLENSVPIESTTCITAESARGLQFTDASNPFISSVHVLLAYDLFRFLKRPL
jgi:hypothetical protein